MFLATLVVIILTVFCLYQRRSKPPTEDINKLLIKSVYNNDVYSAAALLSKGANPNIHDGYLAEEASDSRRSSHLPLQLEDKLQQLLHKRRQYWVTSKQTALHIALCRVVGIEHVPSNPAIVELLVQAGADVNAEGDDGGFPLYLAADTKQCGLVKLLLEHGAKVNRIDAVRGSALSIAAFRGDAATVKLLLQKGADPNLANAYGWTPLMNAVRSHNEKVVLLLLKRGASQHARTCLGESALSLAASEHLPGIERILKTQ